ncbi:MAG: hypothetical protein H5U08_03395 [Thermogutta sp.]|uniref:hypothetical protein n=1 Tax=Thermogutta sp. TaxID=1962930 RepID=UPI0019A83DCA|nr:hypothetical protein [Thermogutta sp.]MBC7351380.1 hypothetical protein [Thermogutta sp.]
MPDELSLILIPLAVAAILAALWRPLRRLQARAVFEKARRQFHRQRESLEARLVRQIAVPVVAGELEWVDCEFDDEVLYLRERGGHRLAAVVLVTLGTDSDWLPASEESQRCGVAIFRFDKDHWTVDPKVYMNLTPEDVVRQFSGTMEVLYRESTRRP